MCFYCTSENKTIKIIKIYGKKSIPFVCIKKYVTII